MRALYRSQTVEQIRALTPLTGAQMPYVTVLPIPGCNARGVEGLCTAEALAARMAVRP